MLLLALRRLAWEDDVRILAASPAEIARRVTSAHGRRFRTHWLRLFNRPEDGLLVAALLAPISPSHTPLLLLNIEALVEMVTWRPALLLNVLRACAVSHEMVEALASRPVVVVNDDPRSQRRWELIREKALIRQQRTRTGW